MLPDTKSIELLIIQVALMEKSPQLALHVIQIVHNKFGFVTLQVPRKVYTIRSKLTTMGANLVFQILPAVPSKRNYIRSYS